MGVQGDRSTRSAGWKPPVTATGNSELLLRRVLWRPVLEGPCGTTSASHLSSCCLDLVSLVSCLCTCAGAVEGDSPPLSYQKPAWKGFLPILGILGDASGYVTCNDIKHRTQSAVTCSKWAPASCGQRARRSLGLSVCPASIVPC